MKSSDRYKEYIALKVEVREQALWITFNDPPMNSIEEAGHTELSTIFKLADADPDIRCIVVTGNGDKAFSAGADINKLFNRVDDHLFWKKTIIEQTEIIAGILECDKPVIARINGHAMGVGAMVALACDITLMMEKAKIADTHVKIGLSAGDGGAVLWPALIGMARARRYLFTGDAINGRDAAEMGLVTSSAPTIEDLDSQTAHWVDYFSNAAPLAIEGTKRALNSMLGNVRLLLEMHLGAETLSHRSGDYREALQAFLEKRQPVFRGV